MAKKPLHVRAEIDPSFMQNGLVVHFRDDADCWVVDPGLPPHAERMADYIHRHGLSARGILLTHAHGDHIAGVDELRGWLGPVPLYLAREEWPFLSDPALNLSADFGFPLTVSTNHLHDLVPGDVLALDGGDWTVLDTSGHSPGGRSFYCPDAGVVIVGDALFAGSIGRTDFAYSNHDRLVANIRKNLLTLPDETRVVSGHGPRTTIGRERQANPFLA